MRLLLNSRILGDVLVIQCKGRIVAGAEVEALQAEVDKQTHVLGTELLQTRLVVLDLGEVEYLDSSGLGALVRMLGVLRAVGGGLTLCRPSPIVQKSLEVTKLTNLLSTYASEEEAIEALYRDSPPEQDTIRRTAILCVDTSKDLLAYLRVLLTEAGYRVHTASNVSDGKRLLTVMHPKLVVCGKGIQELPAAVALLEQIQQSSGIQLLSLPAEFSTTDAGEAGKDLVERIQSLLK